MINESHQSDQNSKTVTKGDTKMIESNQNTVNCQICNNPIHVSELYINLDCEHELICDTCYENHVIQNGTCFQKIITKNT